MESKEMNRKWDSMSVISFIISIVFFLIMLLLLFILVNMVGGRTEPYTSGEIVSYAIIFALFFLIPFSITFILGLFGYKKTSAEPKLKGKKLAITSMAISVFFILIMIIILIGQVKDMSKYEGRPKICAVQYGGICQETCSGELATSEITNCNSQEMICCKVVQ